MILCFSATGNSQYCADVLARDTDDLVVSIHDCLKHNIRVIDAASSERLGIVCPIYDWADTTKRTQEKRNYSRQSRESMNDKMIRLIENDMQGMKKLNMCIVGVLENIGFSGIF